MSETGRRTLDIVGGLLGLVVLSPLLLAVAFYVRITMGRPTLFRQVRPGLGGHPFTLYKFRTMQAGTPEAVDPHDDAHRMTSTGRFLREWSLDELPQLWNVVRGDMSLVGPRPLLMEYLPLYSARQRRRHDVRPGLTGWAQVRGRNALSWQDRLELDVWYVENRSILLDLRILALTLVAVLRRRGVTQPGRATMDPFRG